MYACDMCAEDWLMQEEVGSNRHLYPRDTKNWNGERGERPRDLICIRLCLAAVAAFVGRHDVALGSCISQPAGQGGVCLS